MFANNGAPIDGVPKSPGVMGSVRARGGSPTRGVAAPTIGGTKDIPQVRAGGRGRCLSVSVKAPGDGFREEDGSGCISGSRDRGCGPSAGHGWWSWVRAIGRSPGGRGASGPGGRRLTGCLEINIALCPSSIDRTDSRTSGKKRGGPFPITAPLAETAVSGVGVDDCGDWAGGSDRRTWLGASKGGLTGGAGGQWRSWCRCCRNSGRRKGGAAISVGAIVRVCWGCSEIMIHCASVSASRYRLLIRLVGNLQGSRGGRTEKG